MLCVGYQMQHNTFTKYSKFINCMKNSYEKNYCIISIISKINFNTYKKKVRDK